MTGTPGADERLATVVLCDATGVLLGTLPPVLVRPRYWPEVAPVVAAVRERDGLEVLVLRLLTTEGGYAGGRVTYLAQLVSGSPAHLGPVDDRAGAATAAELGGAGPAYRMWWAQPDALAGLPAWVDATLRERGRARTGPLRQVKTWNLSLLLTAPAEGGAVWVKATPPFLADERGVLARVAALAPGLGPAVLAHDGDRRLVLLDEAPGDDQWGLADERVIDTMVERWMAVQRASTDDLGHLLSLGAADLRPAALVPAVAAAAARPETRGALSATERGHLDRLLDGLPARLAAVAECGLPDTLLHGDLHPGNWRRRVSPAERLTLLDWGDVAVGQPLLDLRAFVERLDGAPLRSRVRARWSARWRSAVPGSDPERADRLLAPVAELAAAATYQRFLDHIEESERVYHVHDPVDRFRAALSAT